MGAKIHTFYAFPTGGVALMARITKWDATNAAQADVTSIAYTVYEEIANTETTASTALTVSSVVFDSLQTDARWTVDSTGYNFRWDVPASVLPASNKYYQIQIAFTPASGEVFYVVYQVKTRGIFGK